jgi:hypothetical protein
LVAIQGRGDRIKTRLTLEKEMTTDGGEKSRDGGVGRKKELKETARAEIWFLAGATTCYPKYNTATVQLLS